MFGRVLHSLLILILPKSYSFFRLVYKKKKKLLAFFAFVENLNFSQFTTSEIFSFLQEINILTFVS